MANSKINRSRIVGVIPARYASSRFAGKVLADIAGKPMIQWVCQGARSAETLDEVWVATDIVKVERFLQRDQNTE